MIFVNSYEFVERIVAAVNNASFPIGKISNFLQHDTIILNEGEKRM